MLVKAKRRVRKPMIPYPIYILASENCYNNRKKDEG